MECGKWEIVEECGGGNWFSILICDGKISHARIQDSRPVKGTGCDDMSILWPNDSIRFVRLDLESKILPKSVKNWLRYKYIIKPRNWGCFENRMAFSLTFVFWLQFSDLPFRSYKPSKLVCFGLHTFFFPLTFPLTEAISTSWKLLENSSKILMFFVFFLGIFYFLLSMAMYCQNYTYLKFRPINMRIYILIIKHLAKS